jgi:hypothetical protein
LVGQLLSGASTGIADQGQRLADLRSREESSGRWDKDEVSSRCGRNGTAWTGRWC